MQTSTDELTILEEVACLRTYLEKPEVPKWEGSSERAGTLRLTNRRIRFTGEFDEWDRPTDAEVLLDSSLGSIKRVSLKTASQAVGEADRKDRGEEILLIETRDNSFEFRLEGTDPDEWRAMISKARDSFLATAMPSRFESSSAIRVRCSFCHRVYDDALDKCPSCGAQHP